MRILLVLAALVFAAPAVAADLTFDGPIEQGALVLGHAQAGATVTVDGEAVAVADDGTFAFGLGRDATAATVAATGPDGATETRTLKIAARQWDVQRVDGMQKKQVTPDAEILKRIRAENGLIWTARAATTRETFFRSGFLMPVEGRLSGVFGSQRILNGKPRSPHSGTDIAAPAGTPIVATADGVVSLTHDDMFYTGQTVMIDHGFGIQSVYAHMSKIDVVDGQWVRQGAKIGEVGATGRVTGAHLHFGISWAQTKLDPQTVMAAFPGPAGAGQEARR